MKLLIENYLTIFLITLCTLLCTSFIKSEIEINNARDFHSYCIAVVEASDFDRKAIKKCQTEAIERGYTLNVSQTTLNNRVKCEKCGTIFDITGAETISCPNCGGGDSDTTLYYNYIENRMCTVELKYNIKLNLLNITKSGVLNGYAR